MNSVLLRKTPEECHVHATGYCGFAGLRQQADPVRLGLYAGLRLSLVIAIQLLQSRFRRPIEPGVQMPVQNIAAEKNAEERGRQCEYESPHQQFGSQARSLFVMVALKIDLHARAKQHEAQSHGEQEDQDGDCPQHDRFAGVGRGVGNAKRALPDEHGQQNDKAQSGGGSGDASAHDTVMVAKRVQVGGRIAKRTHFQEPTTLFAERTVHAYLLSAIAVLRNEPNLP